MTILTRIRRIFEASVPFFERAYLKNDQSAVGAITVPRVRLFI